MPKAVPAEERERVVALSQRVGVEEAARRTGWGRSTIERWRHDAGITRGRVKVGGKWAWKRPLSPEQEARHQAAVVALRARGFYV